VRQGPHPFARAAIVGAYTVVFYGALPSLLWVVADGLDGLLGWSWRPWPWAWGLTAAALALHVSAVSTLWWKGGGPPITALPPPRFTGGGLYGLVRHPIYFTYNLLLPPLGLGLGSPSLTVVVALAFAPCWILYASVEERFLLRRFGDTYRAYQRRVGLLPGVFKRR
jgi:protein-S-isoprenylcysteine O-methyltransferase Ste14